MVPPSNTNFWWWIHPSTLCTPRICLIIPSHVEDWIVVLGIHINSTQLLGFLPLQLCIYHQSSSHLTSWPDERTIMLEHWGRLPWVSSPPWAPPTFYIVFSTLGTKLNRWSPNAYADGCHRSPCPGPLFLFHPANWNHPHMTQRDIGLLVELETGSCLSPGY